MKKRNEKKRNNEVKLEMNLKFHQVNIKRKK